jgi:hypothetical protein
MRWFLFPAIAVLTFLSLPLTGVSAAEPADSKARAGMAVWDTGQPSATPLTSAALKNESTVIPTDKVAASFKGDAVMTNGRVLAVLRQQDAAAEVYSVQADGAVARLRLHVLAVDGEPAARLQRLALVENTKGTACLEAAYKTAKGADLAVKFRIKRGDIAVQLEPGTGAARVRVECTGRFVVLPDFFADDITIDASKISGAAAEIPSENFLLHLTGKNDAIAMCVFENRQDVKVTVAGTGSQRVITGSEIGFGGKKVWVALMAAPQIWHAVELKASDAQKVVPLDWKMPFAAQWRVELTRPNGLVDSWDMLLPAPQGDGFVKPAWFGGPKEEVRASRKRFTEMFGDFFYPCWTDREGRGYLQPLKMKTRTQFVSVLEYQGPAVLYPFNRQTETPPDAFTMVDVARNALGVGPCDYILNLEAQKAQYKGKATCPTQDLLMGIYQKGEQKKRHEQIDKALDDTLVFVKHIRGRITDYLECGQKVRKYLAEQKKAQPQLAEAIDDLDKIAQEMEARFKEREDRVKTPEFVTQMNADFRKNVLDYEGPDALERCKKYADALVKIGGNQDKLVSECRWVARVLRQRAGILVAQDPRMAAIAAEIRARTGEVLLNPSRHESARQ